MDQRTTVRLRTYVMVANSYSATSVAFGAWAAAAIGGWERPQCYGYATLAVVSIKWKGTVAGRGEPPT